MSCLRQFDARRRRDFSRLAAVVLLAVCALTVSLATRYSFRANSATHSVRSVSERKSLDTSRQHLDKDALQWVAPVARLTSLEAPQFYPRVQPVGPPLLSVLIDENLYNRPPPVS
jgi:hypothetical protein